MEEARKLFQKTATAPAGEHKDKLAAKKQHEKEVHEALKAVQKEKKEKTKEEKAAAAALLKEERMLHDTKRAHADARHQAKRDEHKSTGGTCEHGVWRCKICFPHGNHH
ncbi:phospholipase [Micractinium conductrix]|uniref:Phospholipase n=1 Tax=Micractinium conductrix TaxID=554055 RepID=A0A2P6V1M1_9CHLO|nr:phospholipase [Micractinium conductrix]|eukprot:PSC67975.1 phospholipase [Micractinium conductrix]